MVRPRFLKANLELDNSPKKNLGQVAVKLADNQENLGETRGETRKTRKTWQKLGKNLKKLGNFGYENFWGTRKTRRYL